MSRDGRSYLHDIVEYADYIQQFTRGMSLEEFRADLRTQHAVLRDLEIIGEAVKRLPEEVRSRHPSIPWRLIARFRDRLAHGYFDLDLTVVWDAARTRVPELAEAIRGELASGAEDEG